MKPKHFAILLICAIFWTTGIAAFVYTTYKLEQVIPYHAKFGISEKQVGLATDSDQLNLGIAPRGGSATRHVFVENIQPKPQRYTFVVEGSITPYVQITPSTFVLAPHDSRTVDIVGIAPANAPLGTFDGTISLLIEQP